jgi:flagellar biosynthesis anti-sigma factor FlgM
VQVEALAAQALQLPEIREQRVQSLRQAVESGSYTADARDLAGAMLAQMISGSAA